MRTYDLIRHEKKKERAKEKALEYLHMAARQFDIAEHYVASMEIDLIIWKREHE